MSDYREIKIVLNIIGTDNIMTGEPAGMCSGIFNVAVLEDIPLDDVMSEVRKRILSIKDVL